MKNKMVNLALSAIMLTGFTFLFFQCESDATEVVPPSDYVLQATAGDLDDRGGSGYDLAKVCDCIENNYDYESLTKEEKTALVYMREEEKLARDVYLKLYEKWNMQIFSNISGSEQRHMDAVLCLLKKYELDDPVTGNATGVFTNTDLQKLYDDLIAQGMESKEYALRVGATIEDLDIFDLMQQSTVVNNEDILAVFTELTRGSRNHLRAFNRNLDKLDVTYEPQYLDDDLFGEIVASSKEKGGNLCGMCQSNGQGKGKGKGKGNCNGKGLQGNNNGPGNGNCDGTGPKGKQGGKGKTGD